MKHKLDLLNSQVLNSNQGLLAMKQSVTGKSFIRQSIDPGDMSPSKMATRQSRHKIGYFTADGRIPLSFRQSKVKRRSSSSGSEKSSLSKRKSKILRRKTRAINKLEKGKGFVFHIHKSSNAPNHNKLRSSVMNITRDAKARLSRQADSLSFVGSIQGQRKST